MIMCNYCGQFYHLNCVTHGVTERDTVDIQFMCPACNEEGQKNPLYKSKIIPYMYINYQAI